jgi:hypothetical protein
MVCAPNGGVCTEWWCVHRRLRRELAEVRALLDDPEAFRVGVDLAIPQIGGSARKTSYDYTHGRLSSFPFRVEEQNICAPTTVPHTPTTDTGTGAYWLLRTADFPEPNIVHPPLLPSGHSRCHTLIVTVCRLLPAGLVNH